MRREITKTNSPCYRVWCTIHQDLQTRIYSYMDLSFFLSLHKFLLNLKLCMNIVYCIMYPFIFLNYFSCIFYGLWIIGVREYVRGRKHLIRSLGPSSSSGTWVGMRMLPASEYEAPIKG
jgi:hypothetical protein